VEVVSKIFLVYVITLYVVHWIAEAYKTVNEAAANMVQRKRVNLAEKGNLWVPLQLL
jgi:hypothetical protein